MGPSLTTPAHARMARIRASRLRRACGFPSVVRSAAVSVTAGAKAVRIQTRWTAAVAARRPPSMTQLSGLLTAWQRPAQMMIGRSTILGVRQAVLPCLMLVAVLVAQLARQLGMASSRTRRSQSLATWAVRSCPRCFPARSGPRARFRKRFGQPARTMAADINTGCVRCNLG